jgi:hypothetical protein
MRIGVDVDKVLTNFTDTFLPFYNKAHGTDWKKEKIHTYFFYEALGISKEEDTKSIIEFGKTWEYANMPLIVGAIDGILELKKKNDLYIITGRPLERKQIVEDLIHQNFYGCFKGISFTDFSAEKGHATPKYEFCKQLGIELMVEDIDKSAIEISKECNIPVIVPKYPWNKNADFSGTKCVHVDGWKGIMKYCRENKIIDSQDF